MRGGSYLTACFRFNLSNSHSVVVPANAGTHNHRVESLRRAVAPAFVKRSPVVMGPGSRSHLTALRAARGSLVRDDS